MSTTDNIPVGQVNKPVKSSIKLKRKMMNILSSISVEPTFFLTMFASVMYQLVVQNLYLEKACRVEIGYSESICDAMTIRNNSGYTEQEETEVQKKVSEMVSLRTFIQGTFPLVVAIFAGSWSDRHNRRKPLILAPILGEIMCCVLLIVNTIFFYELPLIFTTLGDSIPFALLGGWSCLNNGIYSYVGSKYNNEEKTMRVGIVTASFMSGSLLGSSSGGFIYQLVGFIPFFSICIILLVIAFVIGYFIVQDKPIRPSELEKTGIFQDIFALKHVIGTIKTGFKSGPNNRRYKVIAVMLVFLFVAGPYTGELYMNYLYTRLKFSWDAAQYGVFTSIQLIIQVSGSVLSVVLFSKILHWEDTFLGMISVIGSSSSNLIFAFAQSEKYLYFAACCDLFLMTSSIAVRSLMSKIVPANELGQVNSVLALVETMVPLIFGPLYTMVYKNTLNDFPGTYFLVSVVIKVFGLSIFIWLYKEALKDRKRLKKEERNEMNGRVIPHENCGQESI